MLEILGVLSIIGILSIGGLYGYQRAMIAKKSVDITSYVSLLSVSALGTNNKVYQNEPCANFLKNNVVQPSSLSSCNVTTTKGNVSVAVTYSTESAPLVSALALRCTDNFYVSTDAKTFEIGTNITKCGETPNPEEGGDESDDDTIIEKKECTLYNEVSSGCECSGHTLTVID